MAAEINVNLLCELTGLGREFKFIDRASDGTPTVATYNYRILGTGGDAEDVAKGGTGPWRPQRVQYHDQG